MDYKTINDYELIYLVNENNEDAFNIIIITIIINKKE